PGWQVRFSRRGARQPQLALRSVMVMVPDPRFTKSKRWVSGTPLRTVPRWTRGCEKWRSARTGDFATPSRTTHNQLRESSLRMFSVLPERHGLRERRAGFDAPRL